MSIMPTFSISRASSRWRATKRTFDRWHLVKDAKRLMTLRLPTVRQKGKSYKKEYRVRFFDSKATAEKEAQRLNTGGLPREQDRCRENTGDWRAAFLSLDRWHLVKGSKRLMTMRLPTVRQKGKSYKKEYLVRFFDSKATAEKEAQRLNAGGLPREQDKR